LRGLGLKEILAVYPGKFRGCGLAMYSSGPAVYSAGPAGRLLSGGVSGGGAGAAAAGGAAAVPYR